MITEHFKKADTSIWMSELKDSSILYGYYKDGEVIAFNSFQHIADYIYLGESVPRKYMTEDEYDKYAYAENWESIDIEETI